MARVTGVGGVFFRARDPKALAQWYAQQLGMPVEEWNGCAFRWTDEVPPGTGSTAWVLFPQDSKYFGPGTSSGPQAAMLNLRVDDLDGLLQQLAVANVDIDPKRDDSVFGRFAWITDPEGNRVELWQPLPPGAEETSGS